MALTEAEKASRARWRKENPTYPRDYARRMRVQAIAILGGVCVRCGITDERVLDVDHVNGDGKQDKYRTGAAFWRQVIKEGPGRYQLLCANDHRIKTYENDEHLHR